MEILTKILILILVTFLPALELRASIPLGILSGKVQIFNLTLQGFALNPGIVFIICVLTNIILGGLVYLFLDKFVHHFLKVKSFNRFYTKRIEKAQKRIKPYVKKYGLFGVALFVAVPLPGSGSYTGALAAFAIGLKYRKFLIANTIGVIIAGLLVTIFTLTGIKLFSLL